MIRGTRKVPRSNNEICCAIFAATDGKPIRAVRAYTIVIGRSLGLLFFGTYIDSETI